LGTIVGINIWERKKREVNGNLEEHKKKGGPEVSEQIKSEKDELLCFQEDPRKGRESIKLIKRIQEKDPD